MGEDNQQSPTQKATLPEILSIMTTEHYNLQSGHSGTISDANGRSSLYLGSVSSGLVALGFVGQVSKMGDIFFLFSLAIFPSLFFLGLVTFVRVLQTAIEDNIYIRGINRIRHFYTDIVPELKDYFILSTHDDGMGTMAGLGMSYTRWQSFFTTAGLIAVINSVIAGGFVGILVANIFVASALVCVLCSVVLFGLSLLVHQLYQTGKWQAIERNEKVLFPSRPLGQGRAEKAIIPAE